MPLIDPFCRNRSYIQIHWYKAAASIIWYNFTARQSSYRRVSRSCRPVQSLWTLHLPSHMCFRESCTPRCSWSCLHRPPRHLPRHADHLRRIGSYTFADWHHPWFIRTYSWFTPDSLFCTVVQEIWSEKVVHVLRSDYHTCICMFSVYQCAGTDTRFVLSWFMDTRGSAAITTLTELHRIQYAFLYFSYIFSAWLTSAGAMFIFISCSSPTPALLGTTNGFAQTVFSSMGAIGPAGVTVRFFRSAHITFKLIFELKVVVRHFHRTKPTWRPPGVRCHVQYWPHSRACKHLSSPWKAWWWCSATGYRNRRLLMKAIKKNSFELYIYGCLLVIFPRS